MPIRNLFRRPAADDAGSPDAAGHGGMAGAVDGAPAKQPVAFERVDTVGSKVSSSPSVHSRQSHDTGEYKMSVVNDSGVYLPPSPVERDASAFWSGPHARRFRPKTGPAPTSSSGAGAAAGRASAETGRTSLGGDLEPFSISRESFDSYRRSFDISARSPVPPSAVGRQSLDANVRWRGSQPLALALSSRQHLPSFPPADESFEDVGLDEEQGQAQPPQQPAHSAAAFLRKRGAFFKFGSDHTDDGTAGTATSSGSPSVPSASLRFSFPGRKRAASGQGAELKPMDRTENTKLS